MHWDKSVGKFTKLEIEEREKCMNNKSADIRPYSKCQLRKEKSDHDRLKYQVHFVRLTQKIYVE